MDTKSLLSVVADEERCKVFYVVVQDRWLLRVIEQPIVTSTCYKYVGLPVDDSHLRIVTLQQVCKIQGLVGISDI